MIKKLSVFLATGLQKRMETDREFRESTELRLALAFPGQLLGELMIGLHHAEKRTAPPFPNIGGKPFLPYEASSGWLDDCFAKANRFEATISQHTDKQVCARIRLFMKGEKMWLCDLEVNFQSDGTGRTSGIALSNRGV